MTIHKSTHSGLGVTHNKEYLAVYGGFSELVICDECITACGGFSQLGPFYEFSGYDEENDTSKEKYTYLAGSQSFTVKEIEVWKVTFNE